MNQLETNLVLWAICSILLFELLFIICLCRCCFNRIKPKRFYVKREEYEYLHGTGGTTSQFQSTILRPPHADELALVGTIREQNPTINFDNGLQNFGFYRDDDEITSPIPSVLPQVPQSLPPLPPLSSSSQHLNWIELRSPPPPQLTTHNMINTAQLSPADYEIRSYPTDDYHYSHHSLPPRPTIIDFRQYQDDYDGDDNYDDDDDHELENFQFHSLRRPEILHTPHIQRTDTSTESFGGNYSTLVPKSILKGSTSTTPPIDILSTPYSQTQRSRTPSKFDESPRISVKVNTDESILIDHPTSAIEKIIPNQRIISTNVPSVSTTSNRMSFASVSQLNEIEWEVPREFQTIVYDLSEERQPHRPALIYSSNENLNNNNNNNNNISNDHGKLSTRRRSQSADVDQRTHVSRIFVPWDREKKIIQPFYLSNHVEQGNSTQQQAFEY